MAMMMNMQITARPPLSLTVWPPHWGKQRGEQYDHLIAEYASCDDDAVHLVLTGIARMLDATPRCPERVADLAWATARGWNDACLAETGAAPSATVCCPECGEWREGAIIAESARVSHADVTGRRGPTVLVKPRGCEHASFTLSCDTCGYEWPGGIPVVEHDIHPNAMPTMMPSSDEYGPN